MNDANFVRQKVSLKWLSQTNYQLKYKYGDVCNGNFPKHILTQVLDFSCEEPDSITLPSEEDNRLCRIANGDYGDDDIENENANGIAGPTQEDEAKNPSRKDCRGYVYQDRERHGSF